MPVKHSVFEAPNLVSAKTQLLEHYYRRQGTSKLHSLGGGGGVRGRVNLFEQAVWAENLLTRRPAKLRLGSKSISQARAHVSLRGCLQRIQSLGGKKAHTKTKRQNREKFTWTSLCLAGVFVRSSPEVRVNFRSSALMAHERQQGPKGFPQKGWVSMIRASSANFS